jgi:hypothetical protein
LKHLALTLFLVLALLPIGCKSKPSAAETLTEHRVEIYEIVDSVRRIDPQLGEQLLEILVALELITQRVDRADASD